MILSVLYKGGLLMASQHMTVGELSSFLMYTFWVGISIAGNTKTYCACIYTFLSFESLSVLCKSACTVPMVANSVVISCLMGRSEFILL